MNFRQKLPLCFGLFGFLCLFLPNTATADSFDWSYQGTLPSSPSGLNFGSGELTTTDGVITEVSGTFDGLAITALLPPGSFAGNDNLLIFPAAPWYLTSGGFSFVVAGAEFNLYGGIVLTACTCGPSGCFNCFTSNVYGTTNADSSNADIGNFTVTPNIATPEPSSMAMLLPAVLGFGLLLGWKRLRESKPATEAEVLEPGSGKSV